MTLTQMLKAMIYVVPILSGIVLVVWLIIRQQNKEREALRVPNPEDHGPAAEGLRDAGPGQASEL